MRPTDPRLRRQLRPAQRPLVGVVGSGVLGSLLLVAQAWVVTQLVLAALDGTALAGWALATVLVFAGRALVGWSGDVMAAAAAARVGTQLRRRLLAAVLPLRAHNAHTRPVGEVATLATRGVAASEPYLTRYLPALVMAGVLPLVTVAAIATQDLLSAGIVLATLPLVPVFGALVGLATRDRAERQWRALASLSGHFLDVMRGLPTLVAFRRGRAQAETIRRITDDYRKATMATLRVAFASSAVLELVATISVALVAVTVGVRLAEGHLALGPALFVLLLAPEAYWPLRRVGAEFHAAAEGVAAFEGVQALADELDETDEGPGDGEGRSATEDLVLDRVTLAHPGRRTPTLHELSAVIPGRGITAVVGPSGCGKSTLLAVLAGLRRPDSGQVRVGSHPVGGARWRSQVAWLPQRPRFVPGTVADNLRLARPDAADDELWAALRRVALEERVRAMPRGLATVLAEDATDLSAGERARLALARVVLAERPWLLLDEPTAHLDELTEQVVADVLVELGRVSGVVVVAHRRALGALADRVVRVPAAAATAEAPPERVRSGPVAPRPAARRVTPQPAAPVPPSRGGMGAVTAVGALASASGVALTATAGWLIVQASLQPAILTMLVAIVGVRTFGLARPVLRYVERLRGHDLALRELADRRVAAYESVVPLVPGALGRRRGDVLASVVEDVDSVLDRALRIRLPGHVFVAVAAGASAVAAWLLPVTGLVLAGTAALAAGAAYGLARGGATRAERTAVAARAEICARVTEAVELAEDLVMWQAVGAVEARVTALSRGWGRAVCRAAAWTSAGRQVALLATGAGVAATAWLASAAHAEGRLSGPVLALLVLLPLALGDLALGLADAGALVPRTRAAARRLDDLARRQPAVSDPAVPLPPSTGTGVELREVTAGWTDRPVLDDVSLTLGPGERVGVTGQSGSGKSTLAALLLRFVDPMSGHLALGGRPYGALPLDEVRARVGLVDDDPHVFASTLAENVRLARPGASDAEVEGALRRAHLGAWLDSLPHGLDTWLGDGNAGVSGGERARIAIARSLLADQPVLVLDEPTAHLDHETATLLAEEVLGSPHDRRALVWITHDVVGLDRVDRLLRLVPPGTWPTLGRPAATRRPGGVQTGHE